MRLILPSYQYYPIGAIVGHVGEGNFHTIFPIHEENKAEMQTAWRLSNSIVHLALRAGGTCTGEHGVGQGKMAYLPEELGEVTYGLMREIKKTLDPRGIMNPGKVFPCEM